MPEPGNDGDATLGWIRVGLIGAIVGLLLTYELWPAAVKLNGSVLGLIGLIVALALLPNIEEFSVPGLGSVKVRRLLQQAGPPAKRVRAVTAAESASTSHAGTVAANVTARLDLGALASSFVDQQPLPAMVALRGEVEERLATVFRELYGEPPDTMLSALLQLGRDGYLDNDQVQLGVLLITSLNAAISEGRASSATAKNVVSLGAVFTESLDRPTLVSAVEFHEQVAQLLASDDRLEVDREVRAGRRVADFRVRLGGNDWLVEAKTVGEGDSRARLRLGVDQLDELLRWFRLTKGVLVVPDGTALPAQLQIKRPGDVTIVITTVSGLLKVFDS